MRRRRTSPDMIVDYADDMVLFPTRASKVLLVALIVAFALLPFSLTDFWLTVLNSVAIFAIGGIGLNLLTGYTGQVSLGQAFFLAVGAFTAAFFGARHGWPMVAWITAAAVIGAALGALIGPVALRLSGNYLAIVTLGLLFVGEHIFSNWTDVTGGSRGTRVNAPMAIGPFDFANLDIFGQHFDRAQGLFWLLWFVVGLTALLGKNIVRTRPGRAMQAIRDRDVAAEVIGVSLVRYKVGAFAVSSAVAAVAGAFYGAAVQQFINPGQFGGTLGLILSIEFIAVIIIGGMGTIYGAVLGALLVSGLPQLIQHYSSNLPFLTDQPGGSGIISVSSFNNLLFGVAIIVFLLAEPRGVAAWLSRVKRSLTSWPFSS